jgi:hypothetical protein
MSLSVTIVKKGRLVGGLNEAIVDVVFDASYPTGGEPLGPNECGVPQILACEDTNCGIGDGGYRFKYNRPTNKLQAFVGNGVAIFTEVGNATDLSAITARLRVSG